MAWFLYDMDLPHGKFKQDYIKTANIPNIFVEPTSCVNNISRNHPSLCSQLTITCSKWTIETLEKGVKYV